MVIEIFGNVSEMEESRELWFIFIVADILNGLFGKRCEKLILELFVFEVDELLYIPVSWFLS